MSNKLCFIYTDTNGLHKTEENVSTKNLYNYARLIAVHYSIGSYINMKYVEEKNVSVILKPDTINFDIKYIMKHNITMEIANEKGINNISAIQQLKDDIKNVDIIISYDINHNIKALQVECFRTAITIDFSKYVLIDIKLFNNTINNSIINTCILELIKKLKIKTKTINMLEQINLVFFNLYENYIKNIEQPSV